jgi:hypothetical protein
MQSVIKKPCMLSVVMLSVVMLNVVKMNVEAPFKMTVTEMTHFNLDCVTKCSRQRSHSHTSFFSLLTLFIKLHSCGKL